MKDRYAGGKANGRGDGYGSGTCAGWTPADLVGGDDGDGEGAAHTPRGVAGLVYGRARNNGRGDGDGAGQGGKIGTG